MQKTSTHEAFKGIHDDVKMGSERGFGIVFAIVFGIVALWPLKNGGAPRLWAAGVAAAFLLTAFLAPAVLAPLNKLWFKFGLLLAKVMNPVVMFVLFVGAVVPTALLMRLRGKDLLHLRIDKSAKSYWVVRTPPGPEPATLRNQH